MSPDLKAAVQRQKKKDASVAAPVPTPTPTPTPDVAKEDPNQLQTPKVVYGRDQAGATKQLMVARDQATATLRDGTKFALVDPNKSGKMHDPQDLVALAHFVSESDNYTATSAHGKLKQISDQIKHLQAQALATLKKAKRDAQLNHASCNFKRRPGHTYHLYEKDDGVPFFSMLSPQEWGKNHPNTYLDSYRLEYDMSWTELAHIQEHDAGQVLDANLLGLNNIPGQDGNPFMLTI